MVGRFDNVVGSLSIRVVVSHRTITPGTCGLRMNDQKMGGGGNEKHVVHEE
jgi:hypothetical protein